MRLTVLICLYLTFLEASVGSLIYPERSLIQVLVGQGRAVTMDELIAAGESIARPDVEPLAARGSSGIVKRKALADGVGEFEADAVPLRKVKRKHATKKPIKRLINTRASVRPKVDRNRAIGDGN